MLQKYAINLNNVSFLFIFIQKMHTFCLYDESRRYIYPFHLQAQCLYILYLLGVKMAVAGDYYLSGILVCEPTESLLVHLARAYIHKVAYAYALATLATAKRNTHKAVEAGGKVVGYGAVGRVEIAWTQNLICAYRIVCQWIVRKRMISKDALA